MSGLSKRICDFFRKNVYDEFRANMGNPRYLALSLGMGVFFALLPIPIQSTLCFGVWLLLRRWRFSNFNIAMALAVTMVSNPLTDPFLFYAYYLLGVRALGMEAYSFLEFAGKLDSFAHLHTPFWKRIGTFSDFICGDVGYPVAVGSLILAVACSLASYLLAYVFASAFGHRRSGAPSVRFLGKKRSGAAKTFR